VSATGRILNAEIQYVESHFGKRRGSRSSGKTGTYDDDVEATLVGGVHEFLMSLVVGPFLSDRTFRDFRIGRIHHFNVFFSIFHIAN